MKLGLADLSDSLGSTKRFVRKSEAEKLSDKHYIFEKSDNLGTPPVMNSLFDRKNRLKVFRQHEKIFYSLLSEWSSNRGQAEFRVVIN